MRCAFTVDLENPALGGIDGARAFLDFFDAEAIKASFFTVAELAERHGDLLEEIAARGAEVILITDERGAREAGEDAGHVLVMPTCHPLIQPIVAAVPIQQLAYFTAVLKGTDVDQPRNLAKSVTVE